MSKIILKMNEGKKLKLNLENTSNLGKKGNSVCLSFRESASKNYQDGVLSQQDP